MSANVQKNGGFALKSGELLVLEGGKASSLKLLLQGKLDVYITPSQKKPPQSLEDLRFNSYRIFDLDQTIFIGVNDILSESKNTLSIAAASDSSLFAYGAENTRHVWTVIHNQKDYGAYVINSLCNLICSSYAVLDRANTYSLMIGSIYANLGAFCHSLSQENNLGPVPGMFGEVGMTRMASLKESSAIIPFHFSKPFIEIKCSEPSDLFPMDTEVIDKVTYFSHIYGMSPDLRKAFFGADQFITESHIKEACFCLDRILEKLRQVFHTLEETIDHLYGEKDGCAYRILGETAKNLSAKNLDYSAALDATSYICDKLKEITAFIEFEYSHKLSIDFKYLEHSHSNLLAAFSQSDRSGEEISDASDALGGSASIPDELKDSARKLLDYSEIPEAKATEFMMNLAAFRNLKDKLSTDETARNIRNSAVDGFFDIYKAIFRKAYHLKEDSRLIRMFLCYGYMDEKLLHNDQVLAFYKLAGMERGGGPNNVYSMKDWFSRIITMEKDPSINQFGQDYFDVFRELKKQGRMDEKDKMAYENDTDGRVTFETSNMFLTNHKLCQGQISTYYPILHKDMAPRNPLRSVVTPERIAERIGRILETDFSAFHREINYRNPAFGIEKELVMMQVMPDFILMPVYGSRAIMWQELSGRVRSTPGRLLLPAFTDENLDDMLVKLVGNFRWELCRTMMGAAWNDVTQSSLTSDYTDYIQFYRKNHDLSDEAKEKVKSQIAKYHSRTRDIFTSDYELWINNESKGNPRLNKVSRSILFKHCPFSKPIREQLERQPMYLEMVNQMRNQRAKMAKELESRYSRYIKANGSLDPVLEENLTFYKNL